MKRLLRLLFGCSCARTTFPITRRENGIWRTYVVCLECGAEITYDWNRMRRAA